MSSTDTIVAAASRSPRRIVLSEGEDARIAQAAWRALQAGIAVPVLVGGKSAVESRLADAGAETGAIEIVDPAVSDRAEDYAQAFHALRRHRGGNEAAARKAMLEPLNFAAMMVRQGDADGTIGGAVATTPATIRAALQIIGKGEGVETVSSFFLMTMEKDHHPFKGSVVFADCGLVIEPDVEELADIALSSAASFRMLTGEEPRVAMLSFSTAGSARHERVTRIGQAVSLIRQRAPDLVVDGEVQFDAAFIPEIGLAKAPDSPLKGKANVFVFPTLESGNIGYKIAERLGGLIAVGPVLQGLARPANDLSRGCSSDDVFRMIAITGIQAANVDKPRGA